MVGHWWGSGDLLDWIIFEVIPAVPKFLYYFPRFPLPPRKHGCDLASFTRFPPSLCSNSLPISTADGCRRKETKVTAGTDIKSDFEVKCQRAVVRLSSHWGRNVPKREEGARQRSDGWRSASLCSILNFRMQTSARQPPIQTPEFDQHLIKWSGGEGIGGITHNMKAVVILDCIEMRRRQLCWLYICSARMLCICTSCTVCPAGLYGCLTHTPSILFSTLKLHSLVQDAGKSGLDPLGLRISASLASLYSVYMQYIDC